MRAKPLPQELVLFHAEICQALADSTRIALLYELAPGPQNVSHLVDALDCPQPTVSRHLRTLRERGIVRADRSGSHILYSLVDRRIVEALDLLRDVMTSIITSRSQLVNALHQDQETEG